jgi:hypothetical protein
MNRAQQQAGTQVMRFSERIRRLRKAETIPDRITKWVLERPDAFGRFADLDDQAIDKLLARPARHGRLGQGRLPASTFSECIHEPDHVAVPPLHSDGLFASSGWPWKFH